MSYRGTYLVGMLVLLFLANICMLMGMTNWPQRLNEGFASQITRRKCSERFTDYLVQDKQSQFGTSPIGTYDGVNVGTGAYQGWRSTAPNEPLIGPDVDSPGPDNLFIFKNNQCKPGCCGATLSCDGGCVCTTPKQRDIINTRGGNRLKGDF
jgi:hypothetical protein